MSPMASEGDEITRNETAALFQERNHRSYTAGSGTKIGVASMGSWVKALVILDRTVATRYSRP